MPKRSQMYPCRVSEGEQKRYCQVKYDGYTKKPSKVEPVWLKDNYGVKEAVKVNKQEIWVDVCDECLNCENYWRNNDTETECEGEEKPCHEFRRSRFLEKGAVKDE